LTRALPGLFGYPAELELICATELSCHRVQWTNVTSDQSLPLRGSAAALMTTFGWPTLWLLIKALNERASCHPVYPAPSNAAPGPAPHPSVTSWSRELKYFFAMRPMPLDVSPMAPGNSYGNPSALRFVPAL
jgi:hypothetical protein